MLPSEMFAAIGSGSNRPSPLRSSVMSAMPCFTASDGEPIFTAASAPPLRATLTMPASASSAP